MNEKIKVFVYGTLMTGRRNHSYLSNQKFIGEAKVKGYEMYQVRSYPGIVPKDEEYILGEVYEIDSNTLKKLDRLEGEGYLYRRAEEVVCPIPCLVDMINSCYTKHEGNGHIEKTVQCRV